MQSMILHKYYVKAKLNIEYTSCIGKSPLPRTGTSKASNVQYTMIILKIHRLLQNHGRTLNAIYIHENRSCKDDDDTTCNKVDSSDANGAPMTHEPERPAL